MDDLIYLFVGPAVLAVFVYYLYPDDTNSPVSLFVSAISLFSALLVSTQFSLHSMLSRPPPHDDDPITCELLLDERHAEIEILGEIHASISYLIAFGVVSLLLSLIFAVFSIISAVEAAIIFYLVGHFALTLLIIIKRVHILLTRSYKRAVAEVKDASCPK